MVAAIQAGAKPSGGEALADAFGILLRDNRGGDTAFLAQMLTLPGEEYLGNQLDIVDVDAVHAARQHLRRIIAAHLKAPLLDLYRANAANSAYSPDAAQAGRRALRNTALGYLAELDDPQMAALCTAQYRDADNMTDRIAALAILSNREGAARTEALADFHDTWRDDAIVMDKWFAIQATSSLPGTLGAVAGLLGHAAFSIRNPNRVRALIGAFCTANQLRFHAADGAGYRFLADQVLTLDPINPQIAARLLGPLGSWRRFDADRGGRMKAQLERILKAGQRLSPDVYEIASKSLGT
jgi:aminopeptidase N